MILASFIKVPTPEDLFKIQPNLEGILFDMDGTLIDTEEFHARSISKALEKNNIIFDYRDVYKLVYGKPDPVAFQEMKKMFPQWQNNVDEFLVEKEKAFRTFFEDFNSIELVKKDLATLHLISALKDRFPKVKRIVVTAAERQSAQFILQTFFPDCFQSLVARGDTQKSKPFPDPFEEGCQRVGALSMDKSKNILAIEDSPTGIASAIAAGLNVIEAAWFKKH